MTVEAYLMQEGATPLRANLVGDIVADLVEVAVGDPVLPTDTAKAVLDKLNGLEDKEMANRILFKDIHEELLQWQTWQQLSNALTNSSESKARSVAAYAIMVLTGIMSLFFGGIIGYRYIMTDVMPSTENLLIVFGPLAFALSLLYGGSVQTTLDAANALRGRKI